MGAVLKGPPLFPHPITFSRPPSLGISRKLTY